MVDVDCATFLMAAAELAAGVVDEPERTRLLDHAEACPTCRSDLDGLADAVDRLVILAPAAEPPPGFDVAVLRRWAESTAGGQAAATASEPPATLAMTGAPDGGACVASGRPGGRLTGPADRGARARWARRRRRADPAARPRLAALAAAAVIAAVVGMALGRLLANDERTHRPGADAPADLAAGRGAKPLTTPDGTVVGSMFLDETDPRTLVMVLTQAEPGERYRCLLVDATGREAELGSWTVGGWHGGSWSIPLPPDAVVDDAAGSVAGGVAPMAGVALRDEAGMLVASGSFA